MSASDLIGDVLRKIFTDHAEAEAYSEAPADYLVAEGLGDVDLSGINMGETVAQVANDLAIDNDVTTTLIEVSEPVPAGPVLAPLAPTPAPAAAAPAPAAAPSSGGSSAPAPAPAPAPVTTLEQIQQVVNNYTTVVYEGDETITNNLFDNSQNIELDLEGVEGDVDLEIDLDAVNANGPGAVAAGRDIENSNIASGEGAVAFDGPNQGVVNTGTNEGIIADGNVDDAIVGDGNVQVGSAETVVAGDGNEVTQVDGSDNIVQTGDGEITNVEGDDATLIEAGGDVENTDIDAESGAEVNSISGDGNAAVQGSDDTTAGFGSGDTVDFGESNDFGGAQIGIGGSTNQDNDMTDVGNTDIDQDTTIDIQDNSTNDSFNTDVEIDSNIEDSLNTENTESFNEAEVIQSEVGPTEADVVEDILED